MSDSIIEAKRAIEELNKAFHEFKEANEARIKELEEKGHVDPVLQEKLERIEEAVQKHDERVEQLAAAMNRVQESKDGPEHETKEVREYTEAFVRAVASGLDPVAVAEAKRLQEKVFDKKAITVASNVAGGFLAVPPQMSRRIIETVTESSPIRQLATVEPINSASLKVLHDSARPGAVWVGENTTWSETSTGNVQEIEIPVHGLTAMPAISDLAMLTSAIDVERWLINKVRTEFAVSEATAFVTGDGVAKPRGLLSYAAGTSFGQVEQVNSGNASALTSDGLIALEGALKERYRRGAVFLMKRSTLTAIRQMKDGQGNYLWQPSFQAGQPSNLIGYPVYTADDVPAVAANALAVVFGNIREAYTIADLSTMTIRRDETGKPGFTRFLVSRYVGGGVVNFEAVKVQKVAA